MQYPQAGTEEQSCDSRSVYYRPAVFHVQDCQGLSKNREVSVFLKTSSREPFHMKEQLHSKSLCNSPSSVKKTTLVFLNYNHQLRQGPSFLLQMFSAKQMAGGQACYLPPRPADPLLFFVWNLLINSPVRQRASLQ